MKNKVLLLFAGILFLSVSCKEQSIVSRNGQLSVTDTQLVNEHGEALMLKGISYGWHNFWPRFYNAGSVNTLVDDWNAEIIRASMGVDIRNGYFSRPEWSVEKIESVVDAAIDKGVYVIIDWHSHRLYTPEAVGFFKNMASKYGEYPNVIYEIYNEPVYDTWDTVKHYSTEVIKAIREIDPDNIILVGSPHWAQDLHIVADDPIEGFENLMYTLHFYANTHRDSLRGRGDYAISKGIPIFVSESAGMEASGNGPMDYEEWQKWIDWMVDNKISWITWSISDKDETCSMLYPSASSEGNWKDEDIKESGLKTREYLRNMK